jgi:hypothetical protein
MSLLYYAHFFRIEKFAEMGRVRVEVRFILRLALYRQSACLDAKPLWDPRPVFSFFN